MTAQQKHCLDFLRERARAGAVPPSFKEIADALGLHSKSGAHRLIRALEEQGFIRRKVARARSLEVVGAGLTADELHWCERNIARLRAAMSLEVAP